MKHSYSALLIDLDDTLIDTQGNSKEALRELFDENRWNRFFVDFDAFHAVYKPINFGLWERYAKGEITKNELILSRIREPLAEARLTDAQVLTIHERLLAKVSERSVAIDGAVEVLEYLQAKYQLALLSNGFSEVQHRKLERAGVAKFFPHVILSEAVGVNKPHPKIFRFALQAVGAEASDTAMVGDSWTSDIEGAKHSGMAQIWVNRHGDKPQGFEPTHTVRSLHELVDIL